jgi:luciferase family oxidoreductase group 1
MSEHHAMETLACTAPEVLLARIGTETRRIRIGSGGIMLPHYSAFKVAEVFRTLHALYPGRVDLGIGRAPGGGPIESLALKRERETRMPDDFEDQVAELLAYFEHTFPAGHPFGSLRVAPEAPGLPEVWMLGSSQWSSTAAAEFSLPYAFAHFFFGIGTRDAIETYQAKFVPSGRRGDPEAIAAVGVICAETEDEAEFLANSVRLLQRRIRMNDRRPIAPPAEAVDELRTLGGASPEEGEWPRYFIGTAAKVRERLEQMGRELNIHEFVVNTITWDRNVRLHSYELLAREFGLLESGEQGINTPPEFVQNVSADGIGDEADSTCGPEAGAGAEQHHAQVGARGGSVVLPHQPFERAHTEDEAGCGGPHTSELH